MATLQHAPFQKLVPPLNFAPVEENLYRSGQPAPINFPFLQDLQLTAVIWLEVEDAPASLRQFARENGITLHHLGLITSDEDDVQTANPWDQLPEQTIVRALQLIADRRNYPLLVCGGMGRHRSGTVIGCLRRVQRWNLSSVSEEYRRFAGSRKRVLIELHIEAFDTASVKINRELAPAFLL
ncbi:putative tyrosine-protein phosphatase [Dipodascopsis tothii]|uniref:putative tyrosine-protein phosphatase n=1 Tax=Dipodascopsis tothii TaxID=44089 RepID=UPI0034CF2A71